ncbi:ComE operon protein 1 [Proteiniborus sp. DW1]|uniref:helix-hairpin-helix domain-containing protein n=1 Tax=Proteiniborus sp. DW1 TaxID=1889883 RepID=UPI00092E0733|nr:helix-hairpin-helix domain-containing protein [Proteiniborus sp. DW1]SCG83709.1 ComE operon protein 1 [Proteiniborus sp. DW1]
MGNFTKREQIVILIFVIIVILVFGYEFYIKKDMELIKTDTKSGIVEINDVEVSSYEEGNSNEENTESSPKKILVHIDGEIINPGVVELVEGARVIDVVNIAGGLTQYADEKRINLAKRVSDEEKIYIPRVGEDASEIDNITTNQANSMSSNQGKINVNTATKEELQGLPGIGPVIAERIIEYRQSHKFSNIDDLKKVSGIGDKKLDAIKEFIIVK